MIETQNWVEYRVSVSAVKKVECVRVAMNYEFNIPAPDIKTALGHAWDRIDAIGSIPTSITIEKLYGMSACNGPTPNED